VASFSVPAQTLYSSLGGGPQNPTAAPIPGTIQAESWTGMSGVQTEATGDTGGGQNVGWIETGDWMDYSVNVASAGAYTVQFRVASAAGGGQIQLRSGATVLSSVNVAATGGWQTWATLTTTANLTAGTQTLRIHAAAGGWNLNWVQFTGNATNVNLALNKTTTVSSTENAGTPGSAAVDGNAGTRWSSLAADPQWIYVDLGATYNVNRVKITWETALGRDYLVQIGASTGAWTTMRTITANTALVNDHTGLSGTGRYIRIYGTARGTQWGYSIFELEVYGASAGRISTEEETSSLDVDTEEVSAYPMPFHNHLYIRGATPGTKYIMRNAAGMQVLDGIVSDHPVNTEKLPAGFYILDVKVKTRFVRRKLIKE
jgi:hypothetical protein